jgi:hypothetical protein
MTGTAMQAIKKKKLKINNIFLNSPERSVLKPFFQEKSESNRPAYGCQEPSAGIA